MDFMKVYIELYGNRENPPTFEPPGNIVFMPVDRDSGEPVSSDTGAVVNEAFIGGTQPVKQ
jgi:membrane carboxypeptidase/penicillin-binding protein